MKTWKEVINGIRKAVMASEVREDIAQMGEYVEQFANTATTKAAEASASAKKAAESAENISGSIDPTLSVSGKAADAAKVGEAVNAESERAKGVESQIKEGLDNLNSIVCETETLEIELKYKITSKPNEYGVIKEASSYNAGLLNNNTMYAYCFFCNGGKYRAYNISNSSINPSQLYAAYSSTDGLDKSYIKEYSSGVKSKNTKLDDTGVLELPETVKMIAFFKDKKDNTPISIIKYDEVYDDKSLIKRVENVEKKAESIESINFISGFDNDDNFNFDAESVKARFFAERETHRNKYIINESKTVYLDVSGGDDNNDGLSELSAVNTFDKAKSLLVNGDTLLIKYGSTIRDYCSFDSILCGIRIDAYGDNANGNPVFDNLIKVGTSDIEKVDGYNYIYRIAHYYEKSQPNITNIQCFIDGKRIDTIKSVNGYPNTSNKNITSYKEAMTKLDSNPNNEAWFSGYENGESWVDGIYYVYFSLSDNPSNHKIEITNHVYPCLLKMSNLVDTDMRHINTRGSAGKDGWNIGTDIFMEDCHIFDHAHHGFLSLNGWMKCYKCSAESLSGAIGYQFHYYGTTLEKTMNKELMFIDCKTVSARQLGASFYGHMVSSIGMTYDAMYIIDCHIDGNSIVFGGANVKHFYVKNINVNDVGTIGSSKNIAVVNGVRGTMYKNTKLSLFEQENETVYASNIIVSIKIYDGIGGVLYTEDVTKTSPKMYIKDSIVLIDKMTTSTGTPSFTAFNFTQANNGIFVFNNCVFAVKNGTRYTQTLCRYPQNNLKFNGCVFFGITNNIDDANISESVFDVPIEEMKEMKWMQRTAYCDKGILKRAVIN